MKEPTLDSAKAVMVRYATSSVYLYLSNQPPKRRSLSIGRQIASKGRPQGRSATARGSNTPIRSYSSTGKTFARPLRMREGAYAASRRSASVDLGLPRM